METKFKFELGHLYKITYCEKFRNSTDPITVITSFTKDTPWHLEFGHPYDIKKQRTVAGGLGIREGEFIKIEPVQSEETRIWIEALVEFRESLAKANHSDWTKEDRIIPYLGETYVYEENKHLIEK
jgi:hypothetical protein